MGYSGKNPHPQDGRHARKSYRREGGSEPNTTFWPHKLHSSMFPSLKSVSFEKLLCVFKFYYSFKLQTSYHIYVKLSSIGSHRILGELTYLIKRSTKYLKESSTRSVN